MPKFKPAMIPNTTPSPEKMDEKSDYATAADLSSSDAQSSDEYRPISPLKRQRSAPAANISTPTPRKNDAWRALAQASASPSRGQNRAINDISLTNAAKPSPNSSLKTPSKSSIIPTGTPSSRHTAIDNVFKKIASASPSPSRPHHRKREPQAFSPRQVIVIEDTDEEEEVARPTKFSTSPQRPTPLSTDSSQSSMNSLFSNLNLSSSQSSLESISISAPAKASRHTDRHPIHRDSPSHKEKTPPPVVVDDIFHVRSSPNVTQRKTQKTELKAQTTTSSSSDIVDEPIPRAVQAFANSPFGTNLDVVIIAHCPTTQKMLDDKKIEWGTQFEIARGVSFGSWTWEDVQSHIADLTGCNADSAYKVPTIISGRSYKALSDLNIWKEFDREQAALKENKGRGLGLMGEWEGITDWYGGQIQQIGRVFKHGNSYKIILEPLEKKRSYRFARFYGSRRFLQLRIPDDILKNENEKVKAFLTKKFILCGRVFLPFHAKDSHLYLVETNEDFERNPQEWCGDEFRMPFRDFVNWHNPLDQAKNYNQIISKYVTRFALGLSNSVPVLEFQEENIHFIDDLTSSEWPAGKKNPPADMIMTDGCGFMNHAAFHGIVKYLAYESIPAAVQGRIDGSKGLWVLHPTDQSPEPKIWIRTSQNKIKNRSFDRAHRILDLVGPSRPSASIALTTQSIVNIFSNGISEETLVRMMEEGLEREVAPLLEWDKPHAMLFLWDAINKLGNISGSRTQRLSSSLSRALGFEGRDWGHEEISGDLDDIITPFEDVQAATYTGRNPYSGAPLSLYESAVELIQAGFHPARNKQLHDKMRYIVTQAIESSVSKYRIPIEESLGAFVIPDPLGVLKEGEIYYRFSRPRKDPRTSMLVHVLEGEVLVGRYPIRLPSDMQRVTAVDKRELDKWPDVIIVSTQGKRSLASILAGGDMDGDELIAIWNLIIVKAFQNKPFTNPPENFLEDNFTRDIERVEAFCHRVGLLSEREANEAFQEVLIANLSEDNVGLYSAMHENAVIKCGYGHDSSIRLAYIFATLLDSSKSGWRLKPGMLQADSQRFGNKSKILHPNSSAASRDILGSLQLAGQRKGHDLLKRYEAIESTEIKDAELTRPYDIAMDYALAANKRGIREFNDEVQRIRAHVDAAYKMWLDACAKSRAKNNSQDSPTKPKKRARKKADQDDIMLPSSRAYVQPLEDICLTPNLNYVKASYAYKLSPNYGFSMAFQDLCSIKVTNSPNGHAPNLRMFDEAKTFSVSFLRALTRCEDEFRA